MRADDSRATGLRGYWAGSTARNAVAQRSPAAPQGATAAGRPPAPSVDGAACDRVTVRNGLAQRGHGQATGCHNPRHDRPRRHDRLRPLQCRADRVSKPPPAFTTLPMVSQVRVVRSLPKVFSMRFMNTGPFGTGYIGAENLGSLDAQDLRVIQLDGELHLRLRLFIAAGSRHAWLSAAGRTICRDPRRAMSRAPSMERTVVANTPVEAFLHGGLDLGAPVIRGRRNGSPKTTLPLPSTVFTCPKPAVARHCWSSGHCLR